MRRTRGRIWRAALAFLPLFAAVGCWGSKDIQNQAYATAIGLDYNNGQFSAYVQVLNFGNVARSENMEPGKEVPVWIGHAEGGLISEALNKLHFTSQFPLYWGHTQVVIVTERFLRDAGIREAIRAINRYREVRYNIFLYGTREKLTDLFVQKSIFNLSPLDTIMAMPKQARKPMTGNRFISKLDEAGSPAMLPSIRIDNEVWKEDKKRKPMLRIDGGYFFTNGNLTSWMSEEELSGGKWTRGLLHETSIKVPAKKPYVASVMVTKSVLSIKPRYQSGRPTFHIKVRAIGFVVELLEDESVRTLEKLSADVIRKQVHETFLKGVANRCDPFGLQQSFYRKFPREWRALGGEEEFQLKPDSIVSFDVKVKLNSTGKYKGRVDGSRHE